MKQIDKPTWNFCIDVATVAGTIVKAALYSAGSAFAFLALIGTSPCFAQSKAAIDDSVQMAVAQFNRLDAKHERLEHRAAGILIFPQVTKGGIALASEFGEGVLQIHGTTVAYYSIASVSVGLTAGMATHGELFMFMTQNALDRFRNSRGWSIGADNSIAFVSKGVSDDYDSNTLKKPILGFAFAEKGLIADISLEESKVTRIDK